MSRWVLALPVSLSLLSRAAPALAASPEQHDFYLSLLGESGVEVFSDERLFALYAAFNALGYAVAPVVRQDPIPRTELSALRTSVRAQCPMSLPLQKRFQDFFDAHALPRDTYALYAMSLGAAPTFAPGSIPKEAASLAGFDKLLAAHEAEAHVANVYLDLAGQLRTLLKGTVSQLDATYKEADKLLPAGAPGSVAVNVLDEPAAVAVVGTSGDLTAIAGSPGVANKGSDLSAAAWAYASARALPVLSASSLPPGLSELVTRVKKRGLPAGSLSPAVYAAQSYGAAVAAQVLAPRRQAILAQAADRGLWLAADLDKLLTDERGKTPPEELLGQRLVALDFKKVAPPSSALPANSS